MKRWNPAISPRSIHRCSNTQIVCASVFTGAYIHEKVKFGCQIWVCNVLNVVFCNFLHLLKTLKTLKSEKTPEPEENRSAKAVEVFGAPSPGGASGTSFSEWSNSMKYGDQFLGILSLTKSAARGTWFASSICGYHLRGKQWKDSA